MRHAAMGRRVALGRLAAIVSTVLAWGCADSDRRKPGLRFLQEKRARLRAGMTIAEVDAVMVGLPRHQDRAAYDSAEGRALPRTSALAVHYGDHVGAGEGDYSLTAFFDGDGKLMDTSIGELLD